MPRCTKSAAEDSGSERISQPTTDQVRTEQEDTTTPPIYAVLDVRVNVAATETPNTPSNEDSSPPISPLQFMPFMNGDQDYLALIDSGAQLNLMSEGIANQTQHQPLDVKVHALRGVDDSRVSIQRWIQVPVRLTNGQQLCVPFAVVACIKAAVVLGLPFLKRIRARVHHHEAFMEATGGPIPLWEGRRDPAVMTMHADDQSKQGGIPSLDVDPRTLVEGALLSDQEKDKVAEVLAEYAGVWANGRRGTVRGLTHQIRLTTTRPIVDRPRVHSEKEQETIAREIDRMITDGVIVPSNSPYAAEIVMVKKKTGQWRMCIEPFSNAYGEQI